MAFVVVVPEGGGGVGPGGGGWYCGVFCLQGGACWLLLGGGWG